MSGHSLRSNALGLTEIPMPITHESLPIQTNPDDEELLRHIHLRDIDQFAELINRYQRQVTRIVSRRVPAGLVDEIAHSDHKVAEERMCPVMMTSFTAAIGLLPTAVSMGIGAHSQQPLARVVVGGMLTSALLIFVVLLIRFQLLHQQETRKEQSGTDQVQRFDKTSQSSETNWYDVAHRPNSVASLMISEVPPSQILAYHL